MSTSAEETDERSKLVRAYDDGSVAWDADFTAGTITIKVSGHGTLQGAHAMIEFLDEALTRMNGEPAAFHFNVAAVKSRPLRTQVLFTKWFIANRRTVRRGVIVGGGAVERRTVNIFSRLSGMGHVRFFAHDDEARVWLGSEP
jgi:hypothetical protein